MSETMIKAKDVRVGVMLDLDGDEFADPEKENMHLSSFYSQVCSIEMETQDAVCISFIDGDAVGFPLEHELLRKS